MKGYFKILLFILVVSLNFVIIKAQDPLEDKMQNEAILTILQNYSNWETVQINGKMKTDLIPMGIKPSIKIYMQRDKRIQLSIRASLFGEVGRADVWGDSIMLINKMKRTYCKSSIKQTLGSFPATVNDLQSLLLGRIALLGYGQFDVGSANMVNIYGNDGNGWMVVPFNEYQPSGAEYGFLTLASGILTALVVNTDNSDIPATVLFEHPSAGGLDITANIPSKGKTITATLELDSPKWGAESFRRFSPDSSYTRLGVNQFFKSFQL